jgi:hypothetical protein
MISIEFEEPHRNICECCGEATIALTRYVSDDGGAHAVYFASFGEQHGKEVKLVVSIGEWGDGSSPTARWAFPLVLWDDGDQFGVALTEPETSPWKDESFLGEMLSREKALEHPLIKEVFHLTDHIVEDDLEIRRFFGTYSDA